MKNITHCSFCGGTEVGLASGPPSYDERFVMCNECKAQGPKADTDEEAIEKWNIYWIVPRFLKIVKGGEDAEE